MLATSRTYKKMNFAAVLFFTVFLFHNAVKSGNFFPTERIDDPEKRTGIAAEAAAKQIYADILGAAPALAAGKQFGFLYLHDGNAAVSYGSKPVRDAIKNKKVDDKLDPRQGRPPFWPANPRNTYILMAMPDKKAHGCLEQDNHGHSEYKMLQQLEDLRAGFEERNKFQGDKCPKYVILATVLNPCFDARVPRRFGCAQDYVEKKNEFIHHCPNTNFHLYVPKPKLNIEGRWAETETLMAAENINIITGT